MEEVLLARARRKTDGSYEKGLEIRNNLEDALQGWHAYMGAYGYGHDASTEYALCAIMSLDGMTRRCEVWELPQAEPEPEAEEPEE